jgi:hypothetical protein
MVTFALITEIEPVQVTPFPGGTYPRSVQFAQSGNDLMTRAASDANLSDQ